VSEFPPPGPEPTGGAEDRPSSETSSPTVWPVFLTYGLVLIASLVLGVGLMVLAIAVNVARDPGIAQDEGRVRQLVGQVAATPKMLLASAAVSSLLLLAALFVAIRLEGARLARRLRLTRRALGFRFWLLTSFGFLAVSQLFDSLFWFLGIDPGGTIDLAIRSISSASGYVLILLLILIGPMAGLAEELFFRGYMQTRLRQRWRPWPAILVTAGAFGLLHLDPFHSVFAFLVGILLGWIAEKAGTILPSIVAHVFNNTVWALGVSFFPGPFTAFISFCLLTLSVAVGIGCIAWLVRQPTAAASVQEELAAGAAATAIR